MQTGFEYSNRVKRPNDYGSIFDTIKCVNNVKLATSLFLFSTATLPISANSNGTCTPNTKL